MRHKGGTFSGILAERISVVKECLRYLPIHIRLKLSFRDPKLDARKNPSSGGCRAMNARNTMQLIEDSYENRKTSK